MASTLFDLTGKVALVTGSTKGIGRAIATELARHGAKVVISSRKAPACEEVAASINAELPNGPGGAVSIPANISTKAELEKLVAATRAQLGKIDVLVCNAAVNPFYGSMRDLPDEAFQKILGVNIMANHWLVNLVLPEMIERKDGSIIIVSSIGGLRGHDTLGAYCISKAADLQLVRNLAVEHGQHNVRVLVDVTRHAENQPHFALNGFPLGIGNGVGVVAHVRVAVVHIVSLVVVAHFISSHPNRSTGAT
jgi:NAD(P)-dependent dehydrogenase (short-subunit alcohol dehydrogenase family)